MKKEILLIGESCRDVFIYCKCNRICPDIPVQVLNIVNQTENAGMAKNVEENLKAFTDNYDIITNDNWKLLTKTRYMHEESNHMFIRVDSDHSIIPKIKIEDIDLNYEIIMISDYDKGFISESDIEYICKNHNNVFIDTKKRLGEWIENARYIKINKKEFKNSEKYINERLLHKVINTRGSEGCYFNGKVYPVNISEIKDVSGAGDTFFASLVYNFLKTNDIESSIKYANECASYVVKFKGVTTIKNLFKL
jgi:bifunctional ADP-heptose synthase (sugar kinase/adenylyltransferase)